MVDYTEGSGKQYHTNIGPEDMALLPCKEALSYKKIVSTPV